MAHEASWLMFPISLTFRPLHEEPDLEYLARGSAADIWKVAQPGNEPISLVSKMLRVSPGDFDTCIGTTRTEHDSQPPGNAWSWARFLKAYKEKVSEWAPLTHGNIVQVYALGDDLNLRVEYCANGCIRDYLKAHVGQQINKAEIISDVLAGLNYLHSSDPPIVHGSLNAGKLFVDARGRTKIGEFGLTALCYRVAPLVPSVIFTGFSRWMSPELFSLDPDGANAHPTTASDIWALACTLFEIISEKLPYSGYKHDVRIKRAISRGEPPGSRDPGFNQYASGLWSTIEPCWSMDPSQRPQIIEILEQVLAIQQREHGGDYVDPTMRMANLAATYSQQKSQGEAEGL